METFTLLKYWRPGGPAAAGTNTTILTADSTANARATAKSKDNHDASDGEDGPYFDLEFALPDEDSDSDAEEEKTRKCREKFKKTLKIESADDTESGSDTEEILEEEEVKLAIDSSDFTDQNVTISPSDELFLKGNLVSIEPSSVLLNGSEENSKFGVSLLKSATKFRVMLLKLKKSKSANGVSEKEKKDEVNSEKTPNSSKLNEKQGKMSGKFFTVKFKVEEVKVPLASLFTRDNSSKENQTKVVKPGLEDSGSNGAPDEKKLTKEVVQKYLKMVKPLYIRVSKRYVEKLKFSGSLGSKGGGAAPQSPCTGPEKGGGPVEVGGGTAAPSSVKTRNNLQAGLKVVRKHLGKSRSASSAEAEAPPMGKTTSNRRDDSLLELQDGIQGAILHCKKSFNASGDEESSSSILCRSVSDPSHHPKKSL